jgi:hypothetical protein
MPNSKHSTHGISNLVSLIIKTKLGLSEWSGASERRWDREKDMPPEQEWLERRHRNEHDMGRDRDRDYDRDRQGKRP